jgi:anti-sigma28 factor (negative regulator of flagellin synthesis)
MEVHGLGGASGPQRIDLHRIQAQRPAENVHKGEVRDRAEISEEARLLSKLAEVPDIRTDKVDELKRLIASGRYETAERIARTVDKILEEI